MSTIERVTLEIEAVSVYDLSHKMSHTNRALQRTVIFVEKRLNTVPTKAELSRLLNTRHVMDIAFTKNNTAAEIGDIMEWK